MPVPPHTILMENRRPIYAPLIKACDQIDSALRDRYNGHSAWVDDSVISKDIEKDIYNIYAAAGWEIDYTFDAREQRGSYTFKPNMISKLLQDLI